MTIVIGCAADQPDREALDVGAELARSGTREPVVVVTIVPQSWTTPSPARVDAEYAQWTGELGAKALDVAREHLKSNAPDIEATFRSVSHRSVSKALLSVTDEEQADIIVVGSARQGPLGQVVVGPTSEPLLHSSPYPVMVAPRGYRSGAGSTIARITSAFSGDEQSEELSTATARWANRLAVPLRIATFGVRGRTMFPPEVGLHAEDMVLQQWSTQAEAAQAAVLERLESMGVLPDRHQTVLGTGTDWAGAVEAVGWERGDVLVVGSSPRGPIARVFVGSDALRVVRHSPVPVIVVPGAEVAGEVFGDGPEQSRGPVVSGR